MRNAKEVHDDRPPRRKSRPPRWNRVNVNIAVAIIGLVGTLGAAVIAKQDDPFSLISRFFDGGTPPPPPSFPAIDITRQGAQKRDDWYVPFADGTLADARGAPAYALELEVANPTRRPVQVQLWFKDPRYRNVYSFPVEIRPGTKREIRFDPAKDRRDVDEFQDFRRVHAVGMKIVDHPEDQPLPVTVVRASLVP